ncbi:hypothetical protein BDV34DRAFT_184485 [Aspergillus parasiticus]|uniref:Zn(2)-C6 fungal-type domain-containing protein n=1 Tax=Aspergillus parasiticus TaxID=5067 RepID=A0A5N6E343_ASPPA|nr:hypothetical protein BDV34DRAFT_184485 [Aspergillus parasiticus]
MDSSPGTEPQGRSLERQAPIQDDGESAEPDAKTPSRPKRGKYISKACNECKRRKAKCNGRRPCGRCAHQSIPCVYPPQNGRQTRRFTNQEEIRRLKEQVAALQREKAQQADDGGNSNDIPSPFETPTGSTRLPEPSSNIQQTTPTSWTGSAIAPDATAPADPSHRQAASNYAFNFRLARTHLDAMGIINVSGGEERDPKLQTSSGPQTPSSSTDPLWMVPRGEAIRLASVYEEEIGLSYPFLNVPNVVLHINRLYDSLETASRCGFSCLALPGPTVIGKEDLQILKMVLASASIIETSGSSQIAQNLSNTVKDAVQVNIWQPVGVKTVEVFTLLAIYEFLSDNDLLAWRLIGIVARWCLELRLNQAFTLDRLFTNADDRKYAIRLFWCIHTLDRRWGFGTGLPFAIQNDDIDSSLPEPDDEVPYLKAMVAYSRIGSKVWYSTYSARHGAIPVRRDDVGYLDYLVTQWVDSLPECLRLPPDGSPPAACPSRGVQRLQLLLHLRAGQMRILLYQPLLHSVSQMRANWAQTEAVIGIAKDTIRRLDHLNRTTDIYQTQQMCFNHFLVTSLGIIFLAVSMAPEEFSNVVRDEFYMALDLVKSFSGNSFVSRRLWNMIRGLRDIGGKLGLGSSSRHPSDDINGDNNIHATESVIAPDDTHRIAASSATSQPAPSLHGAFSTLESSTILSQPLGGETGLSETISGLQMTQDLSEMFETMEQGRGFLDSWGSIHEIPRGPSSIADIDFSQIVADLF